MKSSCKILKGLEVDERAVAIGCSGCVPTSGVRRASAGAALITSLDDIRAQAERQAALIIAEAQEKARAVLSEAEATVTEMLASARSEGYENGYEAGLAAATEEMRQQLQTIVSIANNVTVDKRKLIRESEAQIVDLVIDVARKVLGREISLDPSVVVKLVDRALERVTGQVVLRIRVNPSEYDLVRQHWAQREGQDDETMPLEIVADKRVKPGGCIVDTQGGTVDAQIDVQLTEIKRAFEAQNELI